MRASSIGSRFGSRAVGAFLVLSGLSLFQAFSLPLAGQDQIVAKTTTVDSLGALIEQVGDRRQAVLHRGDTLTFVYRTDAAEAGLLTMLDAPLERQGRTGPFVGRITVPESQRLIMSYAFTENDEDGWPKLRGLRGPQAPELPQSIDQLEGALLEYQIESEHLGEVRGLDVYLPKVDDDAPLPVVYLTDGQALGEVVGAIEWKIRSEAIAPVLVVGVHSGEYIGNRQKVFRTEYDHRAQEYLSGLGHERYERHHRFLIEEIMPFVEQRHNASSRREDRVLSGYSNGGAYAVTLGVEHPEVVADVFAYSVAFFDRDALRGSAAGKALPRFRLAGGTLESFIKGSRDAHAILVEAGADATFRSFVAGHDPLMWEIALLQDLEARFPGPAKR